jgi:hypothetical protein
MTQGEGALINFGLRSMAQGDLPGGVHGQLMH